MNAFLDEVPPFCHTQGCTCPTGYELVETVQSKTCRLIESTSDVSTGESEEERRELFYDKVPIGILIKIKYFDLAF